VQYIYPWLDANGMVESVGAAFHNLSKPFHPWVVWEMNPKKFPVNSAEIGFMGQILALVSYVVVSLVTCRKSFNMDKMLHRGIYSENTNEVKVEKKPFRLGEFMNKNILGIDKNYTKGDKVLAWSVFSYSFIYTFIILFAAVVIWNFVTPWDDKAWGTYFFVKQFLIVGLIGIVSTFWFGIGGTVDLFRLYRDLANKETNDLDDGRVVNNMSVADLAKMQEIDKNKDVEKADK
jgi:hypothetical protein